MGVFLLSKGGHKKDSRGCLAGKARRTQGQSQQESPFREVLEHVTGNADIGCGLQNDAARPPCNEERQLGRIQRKMQKRRNVIGVDPRRIREASEKVAKDGIGRLGIVQEILRKSTDFLLPVIAPVGGMGVTLSYVCPHCNCFPLDDYIWWVSTGHGDGNNRKRKHCSWLVCVEADTYPTGYWFCSSLPMPMKQRCSKARGATRVFVKI